MRKVLFNLIAAIAIIEVSAINVYAQQCANPKNSALGSINCGGNQATCHQGPKTALGGAVRCTCSATCLSPQAITASVAATRGVQWGSYIGPPCNSPLLGYAEGGTTTNNNPSTATAVYAFVQLEGNYVGGPYSLSQQTVDCFDGTVDDDPPINGLC